MKLNTITIAITLLSTITVFSALAYNGSQMTEEPKKMEQTEKAKPELVKTPVISLQQVAVVSVIPASYQAEVVGYGEAKSHYELMFATEVGGRVVTVSRDFESGLVVKKDTVLLTIDSTSYQQALTQAKSDLAQAELNLLEEQRQGEQAKSEWQRSGLKGEPDSPLVLRSPQLAQVKAAFENAKLELKKAQQDVESTMVKAPFDALVVTRDVQPGSYVQVGTQVATLYSIDEVKVDVPLSENQWNNLPLLDNEQLKEFSWPVTLQSSVGQYQWQGSVDRIEQHLDQDTRQRSLIVTVKKPLEQEHDLYPGTFVKASIHGASIEGLWQLPASSISQQGDIWFVDNRGLLQKSAVMPLFEKNGYVYVDPTEISLMASQGESVQIVKRPLTSFQQGIKVIAKVEG